MVKINLFRTSELLQSEHKWLKQQLDARLGLTLGVDIAFVTSSSDALQAPVIVALGGASRAILTAANPESDAASRGLIESFADRIIVTTWGLSEAIKQTSVAKDFLVDVLRARVYAYGFGNRSTGYVSSVEVAGDGSSHPFAVDQFEQFVSSFQQAMGV